MCGNLAVAFTKISAVQEFYQYCTSFGYASSFWVIKDLISEQVLIQLITAESDWYW